MGKVLGLLLVFCFAVVGLYKFLNPLYPKRNLTIGAPPTGFRRISYLRVGIFLFLGTFLTVLAARELAEQIQIQLSWIPTRGVVTERIRFDGGRHASYAVHFHYRTSHETGTVERDAVDPRRHKFPPDVAEEIDVLYDPENPDNAIVDSIIAHWDFMPFMLIGLILLVLSSRSGLLILKIHRTERLLRGGGAIAKIEGRFLSSKTNPFLSLKKATAWILSVEYKDMSGRRYVVQSEPIWKLDPDTWARPDVPVPLLINRQNPPEAWVLTQDYYAACEKAGTSKEGGFQK